MGMKARQRHQWRSEQPGLLFSVHVTERCELCGLRRAEVARHSRTQYGGGMYQAVYETGYTRKLGVNTDEAFIIPADKRVPPCPGKRR